MSCVVEGVREVLVLDRDRVMCTGACQSTKQQPQTSVESIRNSIRVVTCMGELGYPPPPRRRQNWRENVKSSFLLFSAIVIIWILASPRKGSAIPMQFKIEVFPCPTFVERGIWRWEKIVNVNIVIQCFLDLLFSMRSNTWPGIVAARLLVLSPHIVYDAGHGLVAVWFLSGLLVI